MSADEEKIIKMYKDEKLSIRHICTTLHIDRLKVRHLLEDNNIPLRSKSEELQQISDKTIEKIKEMYLNKKPIPEIMATLNIGHTTVFRILNKYDIQKHEKQKDKLIPFTLEIINAYAVQRKSLQTIANIYQVSKKAIHQLLIKNEIILRDSAEGKIVKYTQEIINKYNSGISTIILSQEYNVTTAGILALLRKNRIEIRKHGDIFKDENIIKEITILYEQGIGTPKIAEKLNCSATAIQSVLKRNNVQLRDMSHAISSYTLDEYFFDIIDSEEKAYILGLLYADGNVTGNMVRIGLSKEDKYILEKINSILKSNRPLQYIVEKEIQGYISKEMYTLSITNKYMAESVKKLGLIPRKSLILTFPEWLTENLYSAFIRGYFDGDGCITISTAPTFSLAGTEAFLSKVQEILMDKCQLEKTKISKVKNIYILVYGGAKQVTRIRDFLYKDATIYLERKKNIFDQVEILEREFPIEEATQLFENNWSHQDSAEKLGWDAKTISRNLKECGMQKTGVHGIPFIFDEKEIIRLYTEGLKTAREIGELYNTSHTTIYKVLEENKIGRRDSHSALKTSRVLEPNKEEIIDLYVNKKMSAQSIADKYGCNQNTMIKFLVQNGVEIRSFGTSLKSVIDINKEEVIKLYSEDKWSTEKIAKQFGVTGAVVRKFLTRWGIPDNRPTINKEEVFKLYKEGIRVPDIAKQYGVTRQAINYILRSFEYEK